MPASPRRWMSNMVFLIIAALTGTTPVTGAQATPDRSSVTRADAIADVDALFDALERIHPDPYFIRRREQVAAERRQLTDSLPETMTRQQWWMKVAAIVASLSDGHTEATPPPAFIEAIVARHSDSAPPLSPRDMRQLIRRFPGGTVSVSADRHLFVTSTALGNNVQRGDRIVSINGEDADRLVTAWMRETSGDSEAHRAAAITATTFTDLLAMHSIVAPYRITTVGDDGTERMTSIEGDTLRAIADAKQAAPINFAYRVLEPGVGYMDLYSLAGDWSAFKKTLASTFTRVSADKVKTLVIDLRRNGGGYTEFGDELLRYLTRTPYRSWARQEVKRSAEMRAQSPIPTPMRWAPFKYVFPDTRRLFAGSADSLAIWTQPSLKTPHPAEPFFSGGVCFLTGPFTFSAAVMLADTVKTFHLATLVGEETGGRANTTLEPVGYVLPRSKLVLSIASGRSVRANGDATDYATVVPDIVVRPSVADIRDGRDPVLDRALDCPSSRIQNSEFTSHKSDSDF